MTSIVIQWRTMTPDERDRALATHVMGQSLICTGDKVSLLKDCGGYGLYACQDCTALVAISDIHMAQARIAQYPHNRPAPRYSQSMDEAWQIVRAMAKRRYLADRRNNEAFMAFCEELLLSECDVEAQISPAYEAILWMSWLTPEKICVAALKSIGYEVVQ